jgi:polysaccharide export outer membrane protein
MLGLRSINALRVGAAALLLAWMVGCAPGYDLPPLEKFNGEIYRLGVGDQIRVLTYGVEQLSGTFRINDAGDIQLPLVGSFHAAGRSTGELRAALAAEMEGKKLLRDPSVSVEVAEYRPIFVLGEVNRPGQFAYQPRMKALTAVAIAGGFTYRAVQSYMMTLRSTGSEPVTGRLNPEAFVAPGDVITVIERYF